MRILIIFYLGLLAGESYAQSPAVTYSANKESDPKARAILKTVSNKMKLDQGVVIEFNLVTQAAESSPVTQKGKAQIKADKFYLELADRLMVSDGKTLWVYLKKRNEIQIQESRTVTEDAISPYRLIKIHESPEFVYIWTGETKNNGSVSDIIEFKPLDTNAEYFKIKVEVDRAKSVYKKITLYFKSGDQYQLLITSQASSNLPSSLFTLDPKTFPGVHIEDIR
jgi:outer membrane lipoprotein carrier protein